MNLEMEIEFAPDGKKWIIVTFSSCKLHSKRDVLVAKTNEEFYQPTMNDKPVGFCINREYSIILLKELYLWNFQHNFKYYRLWDLLDCRKPVITVMNGTRVVEVFSGFLQKNLIFW